MFVTHLHPNLTGATPLEKAASRIGFGEGLVEAGKRDERVHAYVAVR